MFPVFVEPSTAWDEEINRNLSFAAILQFVHVLRASMISGPRDST